MAVTSPATTEPVRKSRIRWIDIKEHLTGYLFILPAFIIIGMFGIFPIGYAVYMSTFTWRVRKGNFIGLGNYEKAVGDWTGVLLFVVGFLILFIFYLIADRYLQKIKNKNLVLGILTILILIVSGYIISQGWGRMIEAGDDRYLNALPLTLFYALGTVPAEIVVALILAYLLYQKIRGQELFRMIYFLPYITPIVASAVVFRTIFSPRETSLANQALGIFGIGFKEWLFEPKPFLNVMFGTDLEGFISGPSMALVTVVLFGVWTYVGYNTVIFLAGLGSIPGELYEAAEIDGANKVQVFRHITLPLLSPVTFYLALVAFIGTFQAFNHIYVMRVPSALGTMDVTSIEIFDTFYKANQYGYAAAQAILLFLIILSLTFVQNKIFGERVFYG